MQHTLSPQRREPKRWENPDTPRKLVTIERAQGTAAAAGKQAKPLTVQGVQ